MRAYRFTGQPAKIDPDKIEPVGIDSSINMMRVEVESFMRCAGMSLVDACELVGLDPADYIEPSPQSRLREAPPLPEEIEARCEECLDRRRARGWTGGEWTGDDEEESEGAGWTPPIISMRDFEGRR